MIGAQAEAGSRWDPARLPPHARLVSLIAAKWASQPIYALAVLGVADLLADGPRSVPDLAAATGANPDMLRRCLRAAAAVGVFAEEAGGAFGLTPMAEHLRTDASPSLRAFTLVVCGEPQWSLYGDIVETVRTGEPAALRRLGTGIFEYLDANPAYATLLHDGYSQLTGELAPDLAELYDFGRFRHVADLAGGRGSVIITLLRRYPHLEGTLLERPAILEQAAQRLEGDGVAGRLRLLPGMLPDDVPGDADAYLLKNTLHCFGEEWVLQVLGSVRRAIGDRLDARLVIVETVVPPGNEFDWSKLIDIEVMVTFGGRERTREEWADVLARAGFELTLVVPTPPGQSIIEARPVSG